MIEDVVFDANIYKLCEFIKVFEVFQSGYACETTIERVLKKCAEYKNLKYNREETCFEKNRKEYEKYINNHLIETKK